MRHPNLVQALKDEVEYLAEQKKAGATKTAGAGTVEGTPPTDLAAGIRELTK